MKSVTRRHLNHNLAQVLDEVLATGESVEIVTRGGRPLVLSVKVESLYDGWVRQGLVTEIVPDMTVIDSKKKVRSTSTTEEILIDVRGARL